MLVGALQTGKTSNVSFAWAIEGTHGWGEAFVYTFNATGHGRSNYGRSTTQGGRRRASRTVWVGVRRELRAPTTPTATRQAALEAGSVPCDDG